MSRVTIKTFTGKEDEYLTGQTAHFSEIQNRVTEEDWAEVDRYYERVKKIPRAWKSCWTDIQSAPYTKVIMLYGCRFITIGKDDEDQHWQAMAVFMNGEDIVNLLLVESGKLLDALWQDHNPKRFEYGLRPSEPELKGSENERVFLYHTVKGYIIRENVTIDTQRLSALRPVEGLNDGSRYGDGEEDAELLMLSIGEFLRQTQDGPPEAPSFVPPTPPESAGSGAPEFEPLPLPPRGVLLPNQIDFFSGEPTEYQMYGPAAPDPFRMPGKDFSTVDAYRAKYGSVPEAWHRLWTNLYEPDDPLMSSLNYDRVVMLTKGNFVAVLEDETEEVWHAAAVFLRGDEILNVLLVKSTKLLYGLRRNHAPKNFEFSCLGVRGISYRPLSEYLNGDMTGQKVAILPIDLSESAVKVVKFPLDEEGAKHLGAELKAIIPEQSAPR